jgi:cytochrome c-type biogenesis protein CcmH
VNRLLSLFLLCAFALPAAAGEFDPALEAKVHEIGTELRCLVCQNQTIADSNAPLARDLRGEIREMLLRGVSPKEIRGFMVERYGEFVLYRPPLNPHTWLLWFGPALFVGVGLWILSRRLRSGVSDQAEEAS